MLSTFLQCSLNAQEAETTTDSTTVKNIVEKIDPKTANLMDLILGADTFVKWDSTFQFIHRYNRVYQNFTPTASLGFTQNPNMVLGLPQAVPFGFQTGLNAYAFDDIQINDIQFYQAKTPLTAFNYVQGAGAFTQFKAMHTQNFSPTWNIVLATRAFSNQDRVFNDNAFKTNMHKATTAGSNWKSQNGLLENFTVFTWNRARRNESWGIDTSQPYFSSPNGILLERGFYVPNISSANSIYKNHKHASYTKFKLNNNLFLFHGLEHSKTTYEYYNSNISDTPFTHSQPFFNLSKTQDSTHWSNWSNKIGSIVNINNLKLKFYWQANRASYTNKYKLQSDIYFLNSLHAQLAHKTNKIHNQSSIAITLSGFQAGNYLIKHSSAFHINKFNIQANLHLQNYTQAQILQNWSSNLHSFQVPLNNTMHQAIGAIMSYNLSAIQLAYQFNTGNASNYTILNQHAMPQQFQLNYFNQQFSAHLILGKWHLNHTILKFNSSNNVLFPSPKWAANIHYYYQNNVFKKAMLARFGFDAFYTASHTAFRYMPSASQFALSNYSIGNNLLANVYFSGQIKNFEFFIKGENFASLIHIPAINFEQYASLWEPYQFFNLKIGINWRFFN